VRSRYHPATEVRIEGHSPATLYLHGSVALEKRLNRYACRRNSSAAAAMVRK